MRELASRIGSRLVEFDDSEGHTHHGPQRRTKLFVGLMLLAASGVISCIAVDAVLTL